MVQSSSSLSYLSFTFDSIFFPLVSYNIYSLCPTAQSLHNIWNESSHDFYTSSFSDNQFFTDDHLGCKGVFYFKSIQKFLLLLFLKMSPFPPPLPTSTRPCPPALAFTTLSSVSVGCASIFLGYLCCSQSRPGRCTLTSGRRKNMCRAVGMLDIPLFTGG